MDDVFGVDVNQTLYKPFRDAEELPRCKFLLLDVQQLFEVAFSLFQDDTEVGNLDTGPQEQNELRIEHKQTLLRLDA